MSGIGGQNLNYPGRFRNISVQEAQAKRALDPPFGQAATFQMNKGKLIADIGEKKAKKSMGSSYYMPAGWDSFIKGTWFPISGKTDINFKTSDLKMWGGNMAKLADYIAANIPNGMRVAFARNDNWIFEYKHNRNTGELELYKQHDPKNFKSTLRVEMTEGSGLYVFLTQPLDDYQGEYEKENPLDPPSEKSGNVPNQPGTGDNLSNQQPSTDFLKEYGLIGGIGLGAVLLIIVLLNR